MKFPRNKAITTSHYDSDTLYKHPYGKINFIIALTDMYDTNTMWTKSIVEEGFVPLNKKPVIILVLLEITYTHFNKLNKTGKTRVSFDLEYYH